MYGNIIINKKKYNKQHIIPLEEVKLESLKDEGRKFLYVLTPRSEKIFISEIIDSHTFILSLLVAPWVIRVS